MQSLGLCKSTVSSGSTEVFKKEALGSKENTSEKRGKQKRRERAGRGRAQSSKHAKVHGDVLAQIKAKENIVTSGDSSQRITVAISKDRMPSLFTQKVGIYNKGKSSLLVSRRRPLHSIQFSQKTLDETEQDLKRVLGHDSEAQSSAKGNPQPVEGKASPMAVGGRQHTEDQRQSCNDMELSPEQQGDSMPILDVARRIAEGLHPRMVYSDSNYLENTKAELRKLLKQSTARSASTQVNVEESPEQMEKSEEPHESGLQTSSDPTAMATTSSSPPKPFFSLPLFEGQRDDSNSSEFRLDILPSAMFIPGGSPSHSTDLIEPFNLVEVELGSDCVPPHSHMPGPSPIVDETSAAFGREPPSPPHCLESGGDFLDLLDNMHPGGTVERPKKLTRPPGSKWMPTPERPPMFPQKLY